MQIGKKLKVAVLLPLFCLCFVLNGCMLTGAVQSTALDSRAVVRLIYLEYAGEEYRALTAVCDFTKTGEEVSTAAFMQHAQGSSPEQALLSAAQQRGGRAFFAQNQLLLIGPQLAEQKLAEVLQYFAQDHGAYRDPAVWLWYGGEDALKELEDPMDFLQRAESFTADDPLGCVSYVLEYEPDKAAILPVLELKEEDAPVMQVGGLAVAEPGELRLYRDRTVLQGCGLLRGRQSAQLLTPEYDGAVRTVQLEGLRRSFSVQNGRLRLTIEGSGSVSVQLDESAREQLRQTVQQTLADQCLRAWSALTLKGEEDLFSLDWWIRQLGADSGLQPEFTARIRMT
ncbi:MAG: hypothetical protein IJ412_08315 [Oscillospiraceae bacterium]|nr:hypothetical protein [Oscillospiraceae bacterium]